MDCGLRDAVCGSLCVQWPRWITTFLPKPRGTSHQPDLIAAKQIAALQTNCKEFGIRAVRYGFRRARHRPRDRSGAGADATGNDDCVRRQPHLALTALLARWRLGLARQRSSMCWPRSAWRSRSRRPCRSTFAGKLPDGVGAKDLALGIIGQIGTDGATGHVIEYAGPAVRALSMEGRMTLCNMSIEAGARAGMIAPDETTIAYVKGRRFAPTGAEWDKAVAWWRTLPSDSDAKFDKVIQIDAAQLCPFVTWGQIRAWSRL